MVKTGARALALKDLLVRSGLKLGSTSPPAPRLSTLPSEVTEEVIELYRKLGGTSESPRLLPGAWDLSFDGLLIELDEELHFNRYRSLTLSQPWSVSLPWAAPYLALCDVHEPECLAAGRWGRRWTSPSCESLFGVADPPGTLGRSGAPRWKQRALYDAMKDASTAGDVRLARLSTHDQIDGVRLDSALAGKAQIDLDELSELVKQRTS